MRIFIALCILFFLVLGFSPGGTSFAKSFSQRDTLTSTDSILQYWLNKQGVDNDFPITKTFYFWITKEELDSVALQHSLLRTAPVNECGLNFNTDYRLALENKKWDRQPLAEILREGKFGRMRSAWTSAWTSLGSDSSGCTSTQLVKVELEDSALIVVFRPSSKIPWEVLDMNGKILSEPEIEKRENQVAVIYYSEHVQGKRKRYANDGIRMPGTKKSSVVKVEHVNYNERTFFLCNESMIKTWHHAVPGLQAEILDNLKYLLLLDAYFSADITKAIAPGKNGKDASACWEGSTKNFAVAHYYFRTTRFADSFEPDMYPFTIDQIIGTLRYRFPRQINPVEKFPSRGIR